MLGVWAYHSYNKRNGTFNGYWYVGHLEGNGYKLQKEWVKEVSMRNGTVAQVTLMGSESESQNHKLDWVHNTSQSTMLTWVPKPQEVEMGTQGNEHSLLYMMRATVTWQGS
jgi:hypothetical protein